jgi:CheY-like chemotaxis protein
MKEPRHILVVEDDLSIREAVSEILELEGFSVSCAQNGAVALERLADPARRPGLILLDLMMPVMDGWSLARALAERPELAGIPVVILSASLGPEARSDAPSAAAVLAKPFELQRLLDAVDRLCLAA